MKKLQDAVDDSSSFEGDENSSFLDEIPESTTLWEAVSRPANSSDVCTLLMIRTNASTY